MKEFVRWDSWMRGRMTKWHRTSSDKVGYTICGRFIPVNLHTTVEYSNDAAGICKRCAA